jgi:gliding motility-associated protein GldM
MAGGKQTPRQRMINILYLVLLGLIALEAPANLLDAFKKIGDSLSLSKSNIQTGIDGNYTAFEKKVKEEPGRATKIMSDAKAASAIANALNKYVDSLQNLLIARTGGMNSEKTDYEGRENVDEGNRLMITDGKAKELKDKINETKQKLISSLDPKDQGSVTLALGAQDPKDKSWEQAYFGDGVPMGAEMTTLIKIQADIKNDEATIQKKLLSKFDKADVILDQFAAVAVAPTSYVLQGQEYKAQVFLTAYDSKANPTITVGGSNIPVVNGQGTFTGDTHSEGLKSWSASIKVKQADGTFKTYTTPEQKYQVAKPSAVVSPDKMNVLYIGVENPLSVSAPGVPLDKIHINMSSGSYTGSGGHYEAKVTSAGEATVSISAEINGKSTALGSSKFRIKRIPDPVAQFAGRNGGTTSAVNLRAQDKVFAHLADFPFDLKYNVTHFTLYIRPPRQDAQIMKGSGAELNAQMKAAMGTIKPGTQIYFDDITAVGPDGSPRSLAPIIITAN